MTRSLSRLPYMPPPFIVFIYLFICFEASSHYVSVTGLDLALQTRLASNSGTPCLCLRSLSQLSHIILLMRFLSFPRAGAGTQDSARTREVLRHCTPSASLAL